MTNNNQSPAEIQALAIARSMTASTGTTESGVQQIAKEVLADHAKLPAEEFEATYSEAPARNNPSSAVAATQLTA